jgi:hypothetical protein
METPEMGQDFAKSNERRAFTRLEINTPMEVSQGESVWEFELLDLSLTGLAVSEPEDLDADYSNPFYFNLPVDPDLSIKFHARLIHMNPGSMGFNMEQLADKQLEALASFLATGLGEKVISAELALLREMDA